MVSFEDSLEERRNSVIVLSLSGREDRSIRYEPGCWRISYNTGSLILFQYLWNFLVEPVACRALIP